MSTNKEYFYHEYGSDSKKLDPRKINKNIWLIGQCSFPENFEVQWRKRYRIKVNQIEEFCKWVDQETGYSIFFFFFSNHLECSLPLVVLQTIFCVPADFVSLVAFFFLFLPLDPLWLLCWCWYVFVGRKKDTKELQLYDLKLLLCTIIYPRFCKCNSMFLIQIPLNNGSD